MINLGRQNYTVKLEVVGNCTVAKCEFSSL